jgi:hypothetical protein
MTPEELRESDLRAKNDERARGYTPPMRFDSGGVFWQSEMWHGCLCGNADEWIARYHLVTCPVWEMLAGGQVSLSPQE